jgi:hypothetical protein
VHLRPLSTVSRGDYVNMYLVPGSSNGYAGSVAVANSSSRGSCQLSVTCQLGLKWSHSSAAGLWENLRLVTELNAGSGFGASKVFGPQLCTVIGWVDGKARHRAQQVLLPAADDNDNVG